MGFRALFVATFSMLFVPMVEIAQTTADQIGSGYVGGVVSDSSSSVVPDAIVTLQLTNSLSRRTTITGETGAFHLSAVEPGTYTLTIAALGFIDQKTNVVVVPGDNPPLPPIVLEVAPAVSKVDVTLPPHELAAEEIHAAEKQRLFAVFPNFFVSYQPNAVPLTAAQKFQLGWKSVLDPGAFLDSGITAGILQAHNTYSGFGQGMEGYGKRFAADYADTVSGALIGNVLTTSIFHQDPRYFYKGGSVKTRVLYAVATAFVRKGDNGHWQPDYSGVIGGLASGEISTLYYPTTSRPEILLFHSLLLGFAGRAADHLMQEFIYNKLTTRVPKDAALSRPVLPEGTAVSLISVDDLSSMTPQNEKPITFVLARNMELDGVVVAEAGSRATAEATYSACAPASSAGAGTINLSLENAQLMIGNMKVPLRSTEMKAGVGGLHYHWLEDTGRIELVLYLARNVTIPPTQ